MLVTSVMSSPVGVSMIVKWLSAESATSKLGNVVVIVNVTS